MTTAAQSKTADLDQLVRLQARVRFLQVQIGTARRGLDNVFQKVTVGAEMLKAAIRGIDTYAFIIGGDVAQAITRVSNGQTVFLGELAAIWVEVLDAEDALDRWLIGFEFFRELSSVTQGFGDLWDLLGRLARASNSKPVKYDLPSHERGHGTLPDFRIDPHDGRDSPPLRVERDNGGGGPSSAKTSPTPLPTDETRRPGPMAINWNIDDGLPTETGSPQSKARAQIAAKDHGDEKAGAPGSTSTILTRFRGGGRGPGMDSFASNLTGGGNERYAHGKKGGGPTGLPTGSNNPAPHKSTTPGQAPQPRESSNEGKGVSASAREEFGVSMGVSGRSGSPGVSTGGVERGVSIDKSQERAAGTQIDKSQETRTELGIDGSSLRLVDSSSGKTLTSYQAPSEKSPATAMAEDTTPAEKPPDPEDDAEASRKQKGGGGSMPNPEDSGGGEGPRTSGVRVSSPNPENTGRAVGGALQVPARLRYAALPNPESRVVDDAPDWLTSVGGRTLEARTFLGRLPGARNYGGPDGGYRPADDSTAGGGTGGPRAYDAYPDPESSGGGGPRARYERPNPEDTNSPHGPGARNREGIAPWSASRNRMV